MRIKRLGLRREVLFIVPVTLLVLVAISTFTLFAYRGAVELLLEERRDEAARTAEHVARSLTEPDLGELRSLAPLALGAALADREGQALTRAGDLPAADLLAPLGGRVPATPTAAGPDAGELADRVAGFAPRGPVERRMVVRVDLPARRLAAQQRGLRVLSVVVLGVDSALALLVFLFLGRLLAPWETLLSAARQVAAPSESDDDELTYLLATFQRALAALSRPPDPEEDIVALQRTLAPSLASGLLLLDRERRVLALNRVGASLLEIEAPLEPVPVAELVAPHPELRRALADPGGAPERLECEIEVAEGPRVLGITAHPLRRDDGEVRGQLILFADLTAVRQRAGEERLARSLEEIGALTAGLAHELRNSLATLRGYLTLAARRPEEGRLTDYLGEMRREADQLQRILDDFLSFARPGSARVELLDLGEVVERILADPALGPPGARLMPISPGDPPQVRGDGQLLERAVHNLVANALEAQRESGIDSPVELSLHRNRDELEIRVEDRGPGIPRELRERLFLPFVTGREQGVGLGLAVSHRIVTLHRGHLRLEDRSGGGTRARITLPLTEALPKVTTAGCPAPAQD